MPRVSIVLPVYNGERYINESIDSIINQTFSDWELIIVNDCSNDSTLDIIQSYAQKEPRVRIINNKINQKLPKSLNIGFANASGEYLTWTSDDNYYLTNALENMVNILDNYPDSAMVCADMEIIDNGGNIVSREMSYDDSKLAVFNSIGACFLYRSSAYKEIGEYDTSLFLVEDYDYWLRMRENYGKILHINEVLYRYRRHDNSLSVSRRKEVVHSLMLLRDKHSDFIMEQLCDIPQFLYRIYAENYVNGYTDSLINKKIITCMPELIPIADNDEKERVIIFGTGHYGRKYYRQIDKEVICFVDNNINYIGTEVENLKVYSFEQIEKYKEIATIVIAMSVDKQYDVVMQLWQSGCKNYTIWMQED